MSANHKVPKEGWIVELASAEENAKNAPTCSAQLRIAVAAFHVRQWSKCKKASTLGLTLEPENKVKKELLRYQKIATKESNELQRRRSDSMKDLFRTVRKEDQSIDLCRLVHVTFGNLNVLHYAAVVGDIHLLEEAVACGAAIDYPVLDECEGGPYPAPPGMTALLLMCFTLAMYGQMGDAPGLMTPELETLLRGNEACAVALVQLGADCTKQVPRPSGPPPTSPMDPNFMYHQFRLYGKTARELAAISGKTKLIHVMREFETKQDRIAKVHCRCGSRLPWLQCHAGEKSGRSPHYMELIRGGDQLAFRYSPLAPCPCKHTSKTYWKCCWRDTSRPTYQNDSTAELTGTERIPIQDPVMKMWAQATMARKQEIIDSGGDLNQPLFPDIANLSREEHRKQVGEFIRAMGSMALADTVHPKSQIPTWDPQVFAGCVERIDNWFVWSDCHWRIDKTELLVRVKEWNDALEQYCNDTGLTGAEREAVIAKHTANPCAPCANLSCQAFEGQCKEYLRCARCKTVAYCGVECQKADWKRHKKECVRR